jgi:hypothetical protein
MLEEKRPLRQQPDDHNFGSLLMLAVTAGAFLLITWVTTKAVLSSSKGLQFLENRLAKACPFASSGYVELGMFNECPSGQGTPWQREPS